MMPGENVFDDEVEEGFNSTNKVIKKTFHESRYT